MSLSNDFDQLSLSPFSNQLIQSGYISLPRMQQALIEARNSRRPFMKILEQITGNPLPPTLLRQYKEHHLFTLKILHGIEFINPEAEPVDREQMSQLVQQFIPFEICRRYQVLPLKAIDSNLLVGMVNPSHTEAQEMLTKLLRSHQISWQRVGISQEDYDNFIEQYIPSAINSEKEDQGFGATLVDSTEIFEQPPETISDLFKDEPDSPVVTLVNKILVTAIEREGTHLEIDPQEDNVIIRYRQTQADTLQPLFDPLPKKVAAPITSRLKIMANLDISQRKTPQKGRITKAKGQRTLHFFVNTLPSLHGEKVSIRIVDSNVKPPPLETLISDQSLVESLLTMTDHPTGLLLISSANQRMIYSMLLSLLARKNPQQLNIATLEESISYLLPGVTQIEVDNEGDKDYASVLRSLASQDLDILMVDHLREPTMARMVVEMSRHCLILTSLIAQDGASALAHLSQMVDQSLLADTLIGGIHHYAIPRLCPTCLSVHDPSPKELAQFGISPAKKAEISFYQARTLTAEGIAQARERGRLCRTCSGTGYQGHQAVYEVLRGTASLKTAIAHGSTLTRLKQTFLPEKSALTRALDLIYQGQASLADVATLFPHDLHNTSSPPSVPAKNADLTERLANFEKLLLALTEEFQQLKEAIEANSSSSGEDINLTVMPLYESMVQGASLEALEQDIDPSKETIAGDSLLYEELTDPGDWDALKRELQPEQETIAADFSDLKNSDHRQGLNPFNPVPDPWS
ncbi:General secretory system II protein E domain protein [Rippkaea orientalis PCC 8801]|uniref:General secretory system II protein E domain protein n=1 Tax=Rippkaea orientalis (strain PCC 8801 / RF-1) TaxID=41431 RepID=B7K3J1_RIPO1|nr:ATPase, T2SS/T4P/T4SS family [Rippkaea orientalis]ACK65333.1 General secretory system II protein E domain protein [Rippkaea orientalis PCC 8801]